MAKQPRHTWLDEKTAAALIGKAPITLRRQAKVKKLPINWTNVNGRDFQYSKEDIDKMLMNNSSVLPGKKL